MKLYSLLALAASALTLTGCLKDNADGSYLYPVSTVGQGGSGAAYAACVTPKAGADDSSSTLPCPTSTAGNWTRYKEIYQPDGTLYQNEMLCEVDDADVYKSQAQWDTDVNSGSVMSNGDYQSGNDCASMSATDTTNYKMVIIFQKKM